MGLFDLARNFEKNKKEIQETINMALAGIEDAIVSGNDIEKQVWLNRVRRYGFSDLENAKEILTKAKLNPVATGIANGGKMLKIEADLEGATGLKEFLKDPIGVNNLIEKRKKR